MNKLEKFDIISYLDSSLDTQSTNIFSAEQEVNRVFYLAHRIVGARTSDESRKKLVETLELFEKLRKSIASLREIVFHLKDVNTISEYWSFIEFNHPNYYKDDRIAEILDIEEKLESAKEEDKKVLQDEMKRLTTIVFSETLDSFLSKNS